MRCGEVAFTYRELNERANQLAHYLRQRSTRPAGGAVSERSAEMMVAVLAFY